MITMFLIFINAFRKMLGFKGFLKNYDFAVGSFISEIFIEIIIFTIWSELQ
jgi:hypothetical protein